MRLMRWSLPLLLSPLLLHAICYEVQFLGMKDPECLIALQNQSELIALLYRPPASLNGLRYRADADLPGLMKVLRAFAYYDASIHYKIEQDREEDCYQVLIQIEAGPPYKLTSYEVMQATLCKEKASPIGCTPLTAADLGLQLESPARSVDIVNAELQLLTQLSRCGYPLASIDRRRVVVDSKEKQVEAAVCVEEGPLSKFGPVAIFGLTGVHPRYIERRIAWQEGETYNSDLVEKTQQQVLKTDLFSSVLISHGDALDEKGELPIRMRVTEAKHKQVSVGLFYATVDGPGVSFGWTHRNVRGMGEIVSLRGDFSKRAIEGELSYQKPDFLAVDQSLKSLAALGKEEIDPYHSFLYQFETVIEKRFDPHRKLSIGLDVEHTLVTKSANNGSYLLISLPFLAEYDTSDDPLDPTRGTSLVYQVIPFQSLTEGRTHFIKQRLTSTFYFPLSQERRFILAFRAQFGSIAGARQPLIPLTELFLGGSIDDLRGYRYKTVSPLNEAGQPLGGRSAIFTTIETRIRISNKIGLVPFFDAGTVSFEELPTVDERWFKSAGLGLRYFAFFGPLRFDVGFPLDRRKGIDPRFRLYASVGQTF